MIRMMIAAMIIWMCQHPAAAEPQQLPNGATVESAFAPGDAPARLVAAAISEATTSVDVMTYQLSNGRLINALRDRAQADVPVRIIIDGATCDTQRLKPVLRVLRAAGADVRCDRAHPIHHNKVVIIDTATVGFGSFNFSPSAERNAENISVLRGVPDLVHQYRSAFELHWEHAR